MAYLDKVSLGGTLYDVTDTKGRAMIAPKEETSTASAAHAKGTYFTYNDLLYRATADITVGGTITPNTNCVAVTVGAETSELKSAVIKLTDIPGDNIVGLSDFTDATNHVTSSVDTTNGTITITNGSSGSYACVQTLNTFLPGKLVNGKTYRLHAKARKISGSPNMRIAIRGTNGNADGVAQTVNLNNGEGFIDFVADQYMKRVTLFVAYGSSTINSVSEFSEIWLKEYDPSGKVDKTLLQSNIAADAKTVGDNLPVKFTEISATKSAGYYLTDGSVGTTGTTTYWHADISVEAGDVIYIDYKDCPTAVSIVGFYADNTFTMLVRGTGSSGRKNALIKIQNDGTLKISGRYADTNYSVSNVIENKNILDIINNASAEMIIDEVNSQVPFEYMLEDVICIGDSLTMGYPPSSVMETPIKQNYPFFLSRMLGGITMTNAGVGGINTKNWYNNQYSNYTMSNYKTAIIFLGTNGGLTDTLDTDVEPYDDYNNYADTNTGCYCKIIEHLKADKPNIGIVLVNIFHIGGDNDDTTREVIEKIGEKYTLPVISTMDLEYRKNPAYHGNHDNVHLTKAGYLALAHMIATGLREFCQSHKNFANNGMSAN